jgi:hypothetical protein
MYKKNESRSVLLIYLSLGGLSCNEIIKDILHKDSDIERIEQNRFADIDIEGIFVFLYRVFFCFLLSENLDVEFMKL